VHLEAVRSLLFSPLCELAILYTLQVRYSLYFPNLLFFTLCKFVILYTFRVCYSLYFAIVYIFIQTVRLYYTPRGGGGGRGPHGGRLKAPACV
jgi:hypothetical protein